MNIVEHAVAAIRDVDKVALPLAAATGTALAVHWLYPDLFEGLPTWVLPTARLAFIFLFTLGLVAPVVWIVRRICNGVRAGLGGVAQPLRYQRLKKKIAASHPVVRLQTH